MAKVMVSFPDGMLAQLDRFAEQRGLTRSGYLQALVENESEERARIRAQQIDEAIGGGFHLGGDSAEVIKRSRP